MKKIVWITAIVLMLSLSIVGCGSDAEENTTVPSASQEVTDQTPDGDSAQGQESENAAPETTLTGEEAQKPEQDTTGESQQTQQPEQGTTKPQQGQSGNSSENEVTGELTQDETKVTVPGIILPDDVFEEETQNGTVEAPTESTVEVTTKPTEPEATTAPIPDVPVTQEPTEPPFLGDGFGDGIELPLDVWE